MKYVIVLSTIAILLRFIVQNVYEYKKYGSFDRFEEDLMFTSITLAVFVFASIILGS